MDFFDILNLEKEENKKQAVIDDTGKLWPFLEKEPRDVQLRALSFGYGKLGFAYFMRQRLGKTLTAFAEFTLLNREDKVDWFFVICPNSLKEQWKNAIEEVNPFIPVHIYRSSTKPKTEYYFRKVKRGGVFIINYESMASFVAWENWFTKFDPQRTYIVADESTKIKDPHQKTTKACLEVASVCRYRRVLTGKPTANSNCDIWSQMKFIGCTERTFINHKYTYTVVAGHNGVTSVENQNEDQLKAEIAPHCYIAEDKYIQGFEKVYEPLIQVQLTREQKEQYLDMENDMLVQLGDINVTAPIALVKYLRLQQISSGIAGDVDGVQHNTIDPFKNPMIQSVVDLLEEEIDHKVIIVCRFRKSIENLELVLSDKGYKTLTLQGGMDDWEIEDVKATFNSAHSGYNVLIAQTQVLSFGHTLCADDENPCDSMVFFENDFSLINRSQCESRPEKYERNKPISYYDFFVSPVNKRVIQALVKKEDAAMYLMGYARNKGIFGQNTV